MQTIELTPHQQVVAMTYKRPLEDVLVTMIAQHGSVHAAVAAINKRTRLGLSRQTVFGWMQALGLSAVQIRRQHKRHLASWTMNPSQPE
jgi:hypothetical protein